jgi:hypothetical protein
MATSRTELRTLKRLLSQADEIVSSPSLLQSSSQRCHEALRSALAITDSLIEQTSRPAMAAQLGQTGGKKTALRGSEYFRQLAQKRKTFGGGRPKSEGES